MKTVILDGNRIGSMEDVHALFAAQLGFPGWYGGTLDALYDCMTELCEPVSVRFYNEVRLQETLGGAFQGLLRVLSDADVRMESGEET